MRRAAVGVFALRRVDPPQPGILPENIANALAAAMGLSGANCSLEDD